MSVASSILLGDGVEFNISGKFHNVCKEFISSIENGALPKEFYYHGDRLSQQSTTIKCTDDMSYKFHIMKYKNKLRLYIEISEWNTKANIVTQIVDTRLSLLKIKQYAYEVYKSFGPYNILNNSCHQWNQTFMTV